MAIHILYVVLQSGLWGITGRSTGYQTQQTLPTETIDVEEEKCRVTILNMFTMIFITFQSFTSILITNRMANVEWVC